MSPRQLPLSSDQTLATRRADQDGSVYLLSGTLRGLGGYPDVEFRWATLTFSGALGDFEAYIQRPNPIVRSHEYVPGGGAAFPGISIPVRNLPFNDADSMLALIDDGNFAWENSEASLLVGYLKPGQGAEDLAAADWTYLISGGVLGPPTNVEMDGFTAPVYMRGVRRAQSFKQPTMPGQEEARNGIPALPGYSIISLDQKFMGAPLPLIIGKPNSWYIAPTFQVGVRGFTVSGYAAGDRLIQFRVITDGADRLQLSGARSQTGNPGPQFMIHYRTPTYHALIASGIDYNEDTGVVTMLLNSGLAASVPRGAFVQEHLLDQIVGRDGYSWVVAGHFPAIPSIVSGQYPESFGWLLPDGSIRIADPNVWPFSTEEPFNPSLAIGEQQRLVSHVGLIPGTLANPVVPCFYDPGLNATVTQQPEFSQDLRADSKMNYPTGGTGSQNANARDGSDQTAASIPAGTNITLTFNSEASGDYADDDTIASVLHVIAYGNLTFSSPALVSFGSIAGSAVRQAYRFQQVAARPFNQTIRIDGDTGGGVLFEAWWEHDLRTTKSATRTADVLLNTGGGVVGEVMQYADLVFRVPTANNGFAGSVLTDVTGQISGTAVAPFRDTETISGISGAQVIPYPSSAMIAIQSYFHGVVEGASGLVNSGVYQLAHEHFVAEDIRWNFVLQNSVANWQELEQSLALQARAHMYYGPTGHEIVFKEGIDLANAGAVQEFRLPGTPRCNTTRGSGPLIDRMLTSEVVNTVTAQWNPDYVEGGGLRNTTDARDEASVALFGEKRDPQAAGGSYKFWAHAPWDGHPTFDASAAVSGILGFYASLGAVARTRFQFDTSWIAHGVERGSPVRVVYAVAPNVYRNVMAEVEEIKVDPINGDRFSLRVRAIDVPTPGLPIFTWEELFTQTTDVWTDYIASGETWKQKWSL